MHQNRPTGRYARAAQLADHVFGFELSILFIELV